MKKTINNKALIEFLDKVKKAKATRSREMRITMEEADNIARELLRHLLENDNKPIEQNNSGPVVDGGTF